MGRLTAGRGASAPSPYAGSSGFKPSGSYSYGAAGSKANQLDRRLFSSAFNQPSRGALDSLRNSLGRSGAYGTPGRPPRIPLPPSGLPPGLNRLLRLAGPAGTVFGLLHDLDQMYKDWGKTSLTSASGYNPGLGGWTRCANPTVACEAIWGPPFYQIVVPGSGSCIAVGSCPSNQNMGNVTRAGDAVATTAGRMWYFSRVTNVPGINPPRGTLISNWFRAVPGNVTPPYIAVRHVRPIGLGLEAQPTRMENPEPLEKPSASSVTWTFGAPGGISGGPPGPPGRDVTRPQPPPPGTKEKKWQLGKAGAVGDAFGTLTEIGDALSCAVEAIGGKNVRGIPQQAAYVARNFDVTDPHMVAQFIKCMALDNLQDLGIGLLNRAAGKAFGKASGAPRGPGIKRGPGFGTPVRMR